MSELQLGQNYVPKSVKPDRKNDNLGFNSFIPDFSFKSVFEYYSMMRLIGYMASGTASTIGKVLDEKYFPDEKAKGGVFTKGRRYVALAEACVFLTNIIYNIFRDRHNFTREMGGAVAAELGKNPTEIEFWDLTSSKNPIVKSMMSRFFWQNAVRAISSSGFFHSIEAGVILNAVDITFERAIATQHTAFEVLNQTIKKVHDYNLGDYEREDVRKQLMEAVQRSLIDDHLTNPLTHEQVKTNQAVFEKLTDLVISKKFNVNEVVYSLGRVIESPDATFQVLHEIEEIEKLGLANFSTARKHMKATQKSFLDDILISGKRDPLTKTSNAALSIG